MTNWMTEAFAQAAAAAEGNKFSSKFKTPGELAHYIDPRIENTPALDLIDDRLMDLLETPDGRLIVSMPPQEGKLVADDTLVATTSGWKRHGDLQIGDYVFHPSGAPIRVVEVHPKSQASLKVTFSDHSEVVVHPKHEWTVLKDHQRWMTIETQAMLEDGLTRGIPGKRGSEFKFQIPYREPLQCEDVDLPIDPYTLGVWLGDGRSSSSDFCHHPDDIYELAYPTTSTIIHKVTGVVYENLGGGFRALLRENGLLNNKHIPDGYLRASEDQRRALLAGLIDTDGCHSGSTQVSFDNANRLLVQQVAELIRTLGYRAHIHRPTPPKLSSSGIQGRQEMWRVTFTPHDQPPARLKRKKGPLGLRRRVSVTNIEQVDPVPGNCITVDSPDGLYLIGEGMLPTHNSQRISRTLPLFLLLRNPDMRIVIVSYEHHVARRWGREVLRDLNAHPELGLRVAKDLHAQSEWQIAGHAGGIYTVGVGGALTSRSCDFLIVDDPLKDMVQAESEVTRENVWAWWEAVGSTRFSPGAQALVVNTRWHEADLAGKLIESEEDWEVVNIPAQANHDPSKGEQDILGREPGEFLESARKRTKAQWETIKKRVGPRTWNALYQGNPAPAEGGMFKENLWKFWDAEQPPYFQRLDGSYVVTDADDMLMSWDLAFKDTKQSDYVVGQVWMRRGLDCYLLDQVRDRMDFVKTCAVIKEMANKWPQAILKVVEDKANGPAVIAALNRTVPGIVPDNPKGSKQARAAAVTPFQESGNVWIPDPKEFTWVKDFIHECKVFPNGSHDDQVDSMSQGLNRIILQPLLAGTLITEQDFEPDLDEVRGWSISPV